MMSINFGNEVYSCLQKVISEARYSANVIPLESETSCARTARKITEAALKQFESLVLELAKAVFSENQQKAAEQCYFAVRDRKVYVACEELRAKVHEILEQRKSRLLFLSNETAPIGLIH